MEGMPSWAVYGVPALVWIVAFINWLKDTYNLNSKLVFPISVVLAGGMGTALYFADQYAVVKIVTEIVLGAVLVGLAASGYYSGVKAHIERSGRQ